MIMVVVMIMIVVMVMVMILPAPLLLPGRRLRRAGVAHHEAGPDEGAALAAVEAHLQSGHGHGVDGLGDRGPRDPGVHQGGDGHVARDARDGIEVQVQALVELHLGPDRFSMAASRPAPKPLSMLTTATPAAQELSMV